MEDMLGAKLRARWDKYGQGPTVEASGGDTRINSEPGDISANGRTNDGAAGGDDEKENLVYRELWCSGKKEDAKPMVSSPRRLVSPRLASSLACSQSAPALLT